MERLVHPAEGIANPEDQRLMLAIKSEQALFDGKTLASIGKLVKKKGVDGNAITMRLLDFDQSLGQMCQQHLGWIDGHTDACSSVDWNRLIEDDGMTDAQKLEAIEGSETSICIAACMMEQEVVRFRNRMWSNVESQLSAFGYSTEVEAVRNSRRRPLTLRYGAFFEEISPVMEMVIRRKGLLAVPGRRVNVSKAVTVTTTDTTDEVDEQTFWSPY
jgi:hypothetical protein